MTKNTRSLLAAENVCRILLKKDFILKEKTQMIRLTKGNGCIKCRGTGYLGRVGIFEVLSVTEPIKDIIVQKGSADMIRQAVCNEGMVTLRENAIKKMLDGETTYQEVIRVTWGQI